MRKDGWEKLLSEYIETERSKPFEWGTRDCVTFTARAIGVVSDIDVEAIISTYGQYDKIEAARILLGKNNDICAFFDEHLKRKPKAQAKRGDVACVSIDGRNTLGIVDGRRVICKTEDDVLFVPVVGALVVWGVN